MTPLMEASASQVPEPSVCSCRLLGPVSLYTFFSWWHQLPQEACPCCRIHNKALAWFQYFSPQTD